MRTIEGQIPGQAAERKPPLILGISGLSPQELEKELGAGGRFVFFEYCISFLFITLRHPSPIYFMRPRQWKWLHGLPYTLVSLVLGWWGLPWGIVYTPLTVIANFLGGRDVTEEIEDRYLKARN